ncbi:MAG: hypothetical protein PHU14_05695 [Methylovulum sp.]|nr:hypothetical protein [Methylovulum sp.]
MKTLLDKATKIATLSLALGFGQVGAANADVSGLIEWDDPSPWTTVASSCAVDESALKQYAFNNADFYYLSSAVSTPNRKGGVFPLVGRCNVDNPLDANVNPKWNTLIVGYMDPDLQNKGASVVARLIQVKRATGSIITLATFDSNNNAVAGRTEGFVNFTAPFDFHNNAYFVQLELIRTTTEVLSPIVYSARLVNSSPNNVPK